jgi:hypothetical protein
MIGNNEKDGPQTKKRKGGREERKVVHFLFNAGNNKPFLLIYPFTVL